MDMETMEISVDLEDGERSSTSNSEKSGLMNWLRSIDILKHVTTERDFSEMFVDGVLFFHVLRELFEEKIDNADGLAGRILPSENFQERLLNWKIINDNILQGLKISKSCWFLEYLAKGSVQYIENLLQSLREIAPAPAPKRYFDSDIITSTSFQPPPSHSQLSSNWGWGNKPTEYYNDAIFKAKTANRRERSVRHSSPFPRMKLAQENVLWGGPPRRYFQQNRPRHQSRYWTRPFPNQARFPIQRSTNDYWYYRNRGGYDDPKYRERSASSDRYYKQIARPRPPPPVQTYCFYEKKIWKRRNTRRQSLRKKWGGPNIKNVQASGDINDRFQQLLKKYRSKPRPYGRNGYRQKPGYSRYLYRYYDQYPQECNYCDPLIKEEGELSEDSFE